MTSKIPWRFTTGHHVDLETPLDPRKFGLDYDIYAGLRTLGYITVLTKADLVLMTTTEDKRVERVELFHKLQLNGGFLK